MVFLLQERSLTKWSSSWNMSIHERTCTSIEYTQFCPWMLVLQWRQGSTREVATPFLAYAKLEMSSMRSLLLLKVPGALERHPPALQAITFASLRNTSPCGFTQAERPAGRVSHQLHDRDGIHDDVGKHNASWEGRRRDVDVGRCHVRGQSVAT